MPDPGDTQRTATPVPGASAPAAPAARPRLTALDPPMVPFALAGLVTWTVAGLVLLVLAGPGGVDIDSRWMWTCLCGALLGILGLIVMIRHDRARARRRSDG